MRTAVKKVVAVLYIIGLFGLDVLHSKFGHDKHSQAAPN